MPNIEWTHDDAVDPYPAVLEGLGKVFAWAWDEPKHEGILGGSEPAIVVELEKACRAVLERHDLPSVSLLNQR